MMLYLSENIVGVTFDPFPVKIITVFASFSEFICEVIKHGSGLLHHGVTFSRSCHRLFDFKPSRLACRPEPIGAILKFGEGICDNIDELDCFIPVLRVAHYARSEI